MNWVPLYRPLSDNWQPTRHTGCFGHMTLYRATSLVSNFCKAWNKQCLLNNYKISSYLSPAEKWRTKRCWKQQLTSTKSPKKDGTLVTFKNIFTKTWMTLTAISSQKWPDHWQYLILNKIKINTSLSIKLGPLDYLPHIFQNTLYYRNSSQSKHIQAYISPHGHR